VSPDLERTSTMTETRQTAIAIYGPRGPSHIPKIYQSSDIQNLQLWQDKASEAVMVLGSNIEILTSIRQYYSDLFSQSELPSSLKEDCQSDVESFKTHLNDVISDFKSHTSRAKLLSAIIRDRQKLVCSWLLVCFKLSRLTFLQIKQHLQSQTSERLETLNLNMEREAIVMKVVTIVTLVYLPSTFVSVSLFWTP
jgi:hypothetical protein